MKKIYDKNGNLFAELNYCKEYFLNYSKHSHETFALSIIGNGEIEVEFHDEIIQYLYPKKIVIFNPNQVHQTKSRLKKNLDYYTLHVNAQWCKDIQSELFGFTDKFINLEKNIIEEKNVYKELINIFNGIISKNGSFENEHLEEILILILKKYTNLNKKELSSEKNRLLFEVEKYILQNLHNAITLKDIAKEVGYDESYITRVFKKEFGLSPHAFLINKRVEKAKRKLDKKDDISLVQLSHEIGFYDQSHFTKVFKRVFAITPNHYKNS